MHYTLCQLITIYNKATPYSHGKRIDKAGNIIWFDPDTGRRNWEVDHKIPKKIGGSNHLDNLQPLESSANNYWRAKIKGKPGLTSGVFENPNCWIAGLPYKNGDFEFYLSSTFTTKRDRKKYIDGLSDHVKNLLQGKLTGIKDHDQETVKRYYRQYNQSL